MTRYSLVSLSQLVNEPQLQTMNISPNQDVVSSNTAVDKRMGNILSFLGEAENILSGLKTMDTTHDAGILTMPLRFSRPILEPLDSSLEPTPLRPCGGGLLNFTQRTPALTTLPVSPKWRAPPNTSPSHQTYYMLEAQTEVNANTEAGSIMHLSFTSSDDTFLSLDDIDDFMEPSATAVGSIPSSASSMSGSTETTNSDSEQNKKRRIRKYKEDQWNIRYQELLLFRHDEGHVMVPHSYPRNQKLAQWVKR